MARLCKEQEKKALSPKTCSIKGRSRQRVLVIRGNISVCIEGSMQPQRPRRISQKGTAWWLLSNYKPTQMLDDHKGQLCVLAMNSQKRILLRPWTTYSNRWHTADICVTTASWHPRDSCRNNRCTVPAGEVCFQLQAGSLPLLVLCCRLCPGCFFLFWDVLTWPALPCQDPGCV